MDNGKKVIAKKEIERNLELYRDFLDYAWLRDLSAGSPAQLADAVDTLCLTWKEAACTHRLPFLTIQLMSAFADGHLRSHKPQMRQLLDQLKDWLTRELGGALLRVDRKAVSAAVKKIERGIRIADNQRDTHFPALKFWHDLINESEFQLSISGSQGLAYCALVFGYECFIVSCFQVLGGDADLRPSGKDFWKEFKKLLGGDPRATYWDDRLVEVARETRNCIAHRGGRAKPELLALEPDLFISDEGLISVQPADNRALFELLKGKLTKLVGGLKARLAK